MIALATIQDYADRYGYGPDSDDDSRITTLLWDASAFVCDVAGTDWTVVDPDDASVSLGAVPPMVVIVVCEAARRAFENPAGLQSETMGDYTWRAQMTAPATSGVFLTAAERAIVRRAVGNLGVGSVDLTNTFPSPALDPMFWSSWGIVDEKGFP